MIDSLFTRAQLAIEEARALQDQSRLVQASHVHAREALRHSVFESAMYRSETKAHRDNQEK